MPFVTGLFIFSFCFVFYIIWHQFLRKDARLSVGLKVLQKKMNMIENFSKQTDMQLIKGIELLDKKNKDLEKIVSEARFCIFKMEKLISSFEEKNHSVFNKEPLESQNPVEKQKEIQQSQEKTSSRLSLVQKKLPENPSKLQQKSKFDFGESPFSDLNFVSGDRNQKKKSVDIELPPDP